MKTIGSQTTGKVTIFLLVPRMAKKISFGYWCLASVLSIRVPQA